MQPDVKKEFDKLNAKLDAVARMAEATREDIAHGADAGRPGRLIEEKVFETRSVAYFVLVISSVTLALILGVLLKSYFG